MVTGVLRRQGDGYVVEVPRSAVERLHLHEGEAVTLELHPGGSGAQGESAAGRTDTNDEAAYLLRSPRNREHLLASLAQAERGGGTRLSLTEGRRELGLANDG